MKHKEKYLSRMHIGKFLKNARKKKKLTLYAVAKLSGISIGQLQSVEKANTAYTAETLIKITNALGIEVLFKDGEYSEQVNPTVTE
jgi:transcriptional regulator with XRE-family HTH domain